MIEIKDVRIIVVTYETQAPDVYSRSRPDSKTWTKISYSPHLHHDPYLIETNISTEQVLQELPYCDSRTDVDHTFFEGDEND